MHHGIYSEKPHKKTHTYAELYSLNKFYKLIYKKLYTFYVHTLGRWVVAVTAWALAWQVLAYVVGGIPFLAALEKQCEKNKYKGT